MNKYAVIMAGGSGQRLWPLSRQNCPKQMIDLINGQSLLQLCVQRIRAIFPPQHIFIITSRLYCDLIRKHLPDIPTDNIIGEPAGRDTANAIGLAAGIIHRLDPDSAMGVFSADQIIEPVENLKKAVESGFEFLGHNPDALLTLGIKATSPHTGFGYLKCGGQTTSADIFEVQQFKEKPDLKTAQEYLASGSYYWNAGLFLWKTDTILNQINQHLPENSVGLKVIAQAWNTPDRQSVFDEKFVTLPKISIDFGVMEKAPKVYTVRLDCYWRDVGSYEAIAELICQSDENNNKISGGDAAILQQSSNNIVINKERDHLIAVMGLQDLVIVHTADATLICLHDQIDKIKILHDQMVTVNLSRYL